MSDFEVHGVITAVETHEIPSKARGMPSRYEVRFKLQVTAVFDGKGRPIEAASYPYDDFRGDPGTLEGYRPGESIRLTHDRSTGRQVRTIDRL